MNSSTKDISVAVVIPTYKRPDALASTLESILRSTKLPDEIVVVDDDITDQKMIVDFKEKFANNNVVFAYYKKDHSQVRRGLSESKNLAPSLTTADIVYFLDDDVILDSQYIENLHQVWVENYHDKNLIGVGGRISNNRPTTTAEKAYRTIFALNGECNWDVNSVGFQVWDERVDTTEKAYYIHGGVSSYRRELLLQHPFAVFSGGRTGLEDVEHCLRVKLAGYHFYYVPAAHLTHHPAPAGREASYAAAKKEGANRKEIYRLHGDKSFLGRLHFFWANIGWLGKKFVIGKWREAAGMVKGLLT